VAHREKQLEKILDAITALGTTVRDRQEAHEQRTPDRLDRVTVMVRRMPP
jgi:hypothetical protein